MSIFAQLLLRPKLYTSILLFMLLQACSPDYNWREIAVPGARVMLPAKPAQMSREVNLEGTKLKLEMHGARVKQQSFTVAYGPVPPTANPAALLASMQKAMLMNIGVKPESVQAVAVNLSKTDLKGQPIAAVPAQKIVALGKASLDGKQVSTRMEAIFVSDQGQLMQAVAMTMGFDVNAKDDIAQEANKIFIDSLRLVVR